MVALGLACKRPPKTAAPSESSLPVEESWISGTREAPTAGSLVVALLVPEPKSQRLADLVPKEKLAAYLAGRPIADTPPHESAYRLPQERAWGDLAKLLTPARKWATKELGVDLVFRELPISQCARVPLALLGPRPVTRSEHTAIEAFQRGGGRVCRFADLPNPFPSKGWPATSRIHLALRDVLSKSHRIRVLPQDPFAYELVREAGHVVVRSAATLTIEDLRGNVLARAERLPDGRQRLPLHEAEMSPYLRFVRAHWSDGTTSLTRAWSQAAFADTVQREVEAGAEVHAGGALALRVKTTWRKTGAPAAGQRGVASVRAANESVVETPYITDARGFAHPRMTLPPDAPVGTATLHVDDESIPLQITSGVRLSVVAERPLYRQNDKVHVRVMAHRAGDGRPVAKQNVSLKLRDAKVQVTTSEFGIASHTFQLTDARVGADAVEATAAGAGARCAIRIKAFQRPTFTLAVEPTHLDLEPGASAPVTVTATYVNGAPMRGAQVWAMGLRRFRVTHAPRATDAQGRARFVVQAPPEYAPTQTLDFRVQDVDGRTNKISISARGATQAPRLSIKAISDTVVGLPATFELEGPAGASLAASFGDDVHHVTFDERGRAQVRATVRRTPGTAALMVGLQLAGGKKIEFAVDALAPDDEFALALDRRSARVGEALTIALRGRDGPVTLDVWKQQTPVHTSVLTLVDGKATMELPLDAAMAGVLRIHATPSDNPKDARRASVLVTRGRALQVEASPQRTAYRPGERAQVDVQVRNAAGEPTSAVLGYWGVDEALLALAPATTGHERVFDVLGPVPYPRQYSVAEDTDRGATPGRLDVASALGDALPGTQAHRPFPEQRDRCARLEREARAARTAWNKKRLEALRAAYLRAWDPLGLLELHTAESLTQVMAWLVAKGTLDRAALLDPWGTPYRLFSDRHSLTLRWQSAGPDRRFETDDDALQHWSGETLYEQLPARIRAFHEFVRTHYEPEVVLEDPIITDEEADEVFEESFGTGAAFEGPATNSTIGIGGGAGGVFAGRSGTRDLGKGGGRKGQATAYVRKDFDPTLCFVPEAIVGPTGKITLPIDLKDSITAWRLRLVASSGDGAVGIGHGSIHVRQPLHASPWLAPHLTVGDVVTLPVAIRNESDGAMDVRVILAVDERLAIVGPTTQTVAVASGATGRATFRLEARAMGKASVRIVTQAGEAVDEQERIVTVHPYARTVESVHNGKLSADRAFAGDLLGGPGEVHLDLYPSPVAELLSGFDGLIRAPHG